MNQPVLRLTIFSFLILFFCFQFDAKAQAGAAIPGDFPDPTVIQANGKYYAVGTSSEWAPHFPIYASEDLRNWEQEGFVFQQTPDWAASSFWAPEYYYRDGIYYLYYSAKRKTDGVSCIGVATSKYPDRDFVDQGIVVEYGTESIDAFIVEEGEDRFMTWKAYGLDDRPIELVASKLSEDGLSIEGEPFSLLMDTAHVGIEGQAYIQKDGYYYMFYSAGACCGDACDYHVQAVRSRTVRGPYQRVGEAVLLGEDANWKCMGHGTFVASEDGELHYLFHGYSTVGGVYTGREGLLARLVWSDKGDPVFEMVNEPTSLNEKTTRFDFLAGNTSVDPMLQWDFRNATPEWHINQEGLHLGGTYGAENTTGIVLTRRPSKKTYRLETELDLAKSAKEALKGLSIYGDLDRAVGLGIVRNQVQVWKVGEEGFDVVSEIEIPKETAGMQLRIDVDQDMSCRFYYRGGVSEGWQELAIEDGEGLHVRDLAPWDRSPRPGLHVRNTKGQQAVFRNLEITEGLNPVFPSPVPPGTKTN